MIAPQELRIGNYVKYRGFGYKILSIVNTSNANEESYYVDLNYTHRHLRGIDTREVEPIELTEEWLLNFGFEKKAEHNLKLDVLTRSIIHAYTHGKVEIELGNRSGYSFGYPEVQFVHQLQNLYFALTGEELTIKEQP